MAINWIEEMIARNNYIFSSINFPSGQVFYATHKGGAYLSNNKLKEFIKKEFKQYGG